MFLAYFKVFLFNFLKILFILFFFQVADLFKGLMKDVWAFFVYLLIGVFYDDATLIHYDDLIAFKSKM